MFTESDDFLFFNAVDFAVDTTQISGGIANPYDETVADVDGIFTTTTEIFDGLAGNDFFILDNSTEGSNKAIFLDGIDPQTGDTIQNFINIENFAKFGGGGRAIIDLSSSNFSLGDLTITGSGNTDDIFIGNDGNDDIQGSNGNDYLNGGAGSDTLIGVRGDDTLIGGIGSDNYVILESKIEGNFSDIIIEFEDNEINTIEFVTRNFDFVITDISMEISGANLLLNTRNYSIEIVDQFRGLGAGVDNLLFSDGTTFNLREIDGNSDPVAADDSFNINENDNIAGNLLIDNGSGPDSDINDDLLSVSPETINTANGGVAVIVANGGFTYFAAAGFDGVDSFDYTLLDGNGGSDIGTVTITVNDNLIDGTDVADTLAGGNVQNTIQGFDGDDFIDGGAGNDLLIGNTGQDTLVGGADDDSLFGNFGDDTLNGGSGVDELDGGFGNDLLNGGVEKDVLSGQDGNDTLNGDDGNDRLFGGEGLDTLDGGNGADLLFGGLANDLLDGLAGNDTLRGQEGDDDLFGGSDRDSLFGEDGNDVLDGGDDLDRLFGGIGSDELRGGGGNDNLEGGDGADTLLGQDGLDRMFGQSGSDLLDGGLLRDVLFGDVGNDTLIGGAGNDNLFGGDDADSLIGGLDLDVMQGGSGDDTIIAGEGNDILFGGDGDDLLIGDAGFDRMFGGLGNDTIVLKFESALDRADQLLDFETGDKLDVSDVFAGFGFDPTIDDASALFRIVISGDDSFLQIARENLVRAEDYHLSIDDLILDGGIGAV